MTPWDSGGVEGGQVFVSALTERFSLLADIVQELARIATGVRVEDESLYTTLERLREISPSPPSGAEPTEERG